MFLHVGGNTVVEGKKIIAILNLEKGSCCKNLLNNSQNKQVEDVSEGKPKALVLTDDRIFITPISSLTLSKRAKQFIV
ncbi:MAG TPA: DUF370 domain-containing protein [Firmicutes bacterium]|jgi:regulator of extracellular matrix RemA (YlzA/DUF370 family)|nr:DUF370 domain-containing protein [Bacillota bacterium]